MTYSIFILLYCNVVIQLSAQSSLALDLLSRALNLKHCLRELDLRGHEGSEFAENEIHFEKLRNRQTCPFCHSTVRSDSRSINADANCRQHITNARYL